MSPLPAALARKLAMMPSLIPQSSPSIDLTGKTPPPRRKPQAKTKTPSSARIPSTGVISLLSDSEEDSVDKVRPEPSSAGRPMSMPHRSRESVDMDQDSPRKRAKTSGGLFVTGNSSTSSQNTPRAQASAQSKSAPEPVVPAVEVEPPLDPQTVDAIALSRLNELKDDTAYATRVLLKNARLAAPDKPKPYSNAAANVFASMRPIATVEPAVKTKAIKDQLFLQTETWLNGVNRGTKKTVRLKASQQDFKPSDGVPAYSHVVRLQESLLMPNVTVLSCWPYFGDEFQPNNEAFQDYYAVDVDNRPDKLRKLHLAQWLFAMAEVALSEARLTWADILGVFYGDSPQHAGLDIDALCDKDVAQDSTRWTDCTNALGRTTQLHEAYQFCAELQRQTGLSVWHLLRRSSLVKSFFASTEDEIIDLGLRECRICFRVDCTLHGQLRHQPDSAIDIKGDIESSETDPDDDSDDEEDLVPADRADIVNPPRVNFRRMVNFHTSEPENARIPLRQKYISTWENKGFTQPDSMGPFFPCHHPGQTCEEAECSCFVNKLLCDKFCSCASDCPRKFQGCACSTLKPRRPGELVCFRDDRCACYQMGRECDPDLCGGCNVREALDISKPDEELVHCCHNASIQRGLPRHTLIGDSSVHALGLFACEHIKPHDFIGEYKGEVITKREAERRGKIYEHQKLSYLFSLNTKQEVDSTYSGNKIRYINHNSRGDRNLYAHILLVEGEHRIALFAERHISPGEELFFDYGPQFPQDQLGGKSKHPYARNKALLDQFVNPQHKSDKLSAAERGAYKKGAAANKLKKGKDSARSSMAPSTTADHGDAGSRLLDYNIAEDPEGIDDTYTADDSDVGHKRKKKKKN